MSESTALATIDDAEIVDAPRGSALVLPVADPETLAEAMRQYQRTKNAILDETDYQSPPGEAKPFVKKSGWAKLAIAFGVSIEKRGQERFYGSDGRIIGAEFEMRAIAPNGRYADGWGFCSIHEPRYTNKDGSANLRARQKIDHELPATARTRAVNIACSTLFGNGEVSFEEADAGGSATQDSDPGNDPAHEKLCDDAMEQLRKLSAQSKKTGKTLMSEWAASPGGVNVALEKLPNAKLQQLITWAKKQLQPEPEPAAEAETWQTRTRRAVAGALSVSREGTEVEKAFTSDVREYMTHHFSTMNITRLTDDQLRQLVTEKFPSLVDGLPSAEGDKPTGQRYTDEQLAAMPDEAKQEAERQQAEVEAAIASTDPVSTEVAF